MQIALSTKALCTLAISVLAGSLPASVAHSDTITVCLDGSCDFTSPNAAVAAANEGDIIQIAEGNYLLTQALSLYDEDIVIRGAVDASGRPTTVLNGQNTTYQINALHQSSATKIENLVLINGGGTHAAVYMFGCVGMTFRNCLFQGNQRGAIYLNSSSATLMDCEIIGNSGTSVGAGIYVHGSVTLIDCVLSGNIASYSGGGIYVPSGAVVNLDRTRVCGNSAPQGAQIGQTSNGTVNDLGGACIKIDCNSCPTPQSCPADLDGNKLVNGADLTFMLSMWGSCPGCSADINFDGLVGGADLSAMLSAWGNCG